TPGRPGARDGAPVRVAFRTRNSVGTRGLAFAAQWLAYALPYRRFVAVLADVNARLGVDVDRYTLIVVDLHHLLLAGLPAHFESYMPSHAVGSPSVVSNGVPSRTLTPRFLCRRAVERSPPLWHGDARSLLAGRRNQCLP